MCVGLSLSVSVFYDHAISVCVFANGVNPSSDLYTLSERENHLLVCGTLLCPLSCFQLSLVSPFPFVLSRILRRSPSGLCVWGYRRGLIGVTRAMCYSEATSGIAHRVPLLKPHYRAARHVASYTLVTSARPWTLIAQHRTSVLAITPITLTSNTSTKDAS